MIQASPVRNNTPGLRTLLGLVPPAFSAAFLMTQAIWPQIDLNQPYNDFISGDLAWTAASKTHDFAAFFIFLSAFAATFAALGWILHRLGNDIKTPEARDASDELIMLTSLPGWLWIFGHLIEPEVSRAYLLSSCAGAVIALFVLSKGEQVFVSARRLVRIARLWNGSLFACLLIGGGIASFASDAWRGWSRMAPFVVSAATIAFIVYMISAASAVAVPSGKKKAEHAVAEQQRRRSPGLGMMFAVASIPAVAWLIGHLFVKQVGWGMLAYSGIGLVTTGLFAVTLRRRSLAYTPELRRILVGSHLFIALALFCLLGIVTVTTRMSPASTQFLSENIVFIEASVLAAAMAALVRLWHSSGAVEAVGQTLARRLLFLQIPLPLLAFAIIPPALQSASGSIRPFGETHLLTALLAAIGIASLWPVYRRLVLLRASTSDAGPLSALVPTSLLFIAVYLTIRTFTGMVISEDDFHFGETIISWQQFSRFGRLPYVGMNVTHGMGEFLRGALSAAFYDGSPNSVLAADAILIGGMIGIVYLLLARLIKVVPALILCAFIAPSNLHFYLPPIILILVLVQPWLLRRPAAWCFAWMSLSLLLALLSLQAPPAILATSPVFLIMLWKGWREGGARFLARVALGAAALGGMALLPPVRTVLFGYLRFLIENTHQNILAHAIPWSDSFGVLKVENIALGPWAWELLRLSWIPVLCIMITFALGGLIRCVRRGTALKSSLLFSGAWALFTLFLVSYTLNRIDPGQYSRTDQFAHLCLTFALPLALLLHARRGWRPIHFALYTFVFVLGGIVLGGSSVETINGNAAAIVSLSDSDASRLEAQRSVLPALGNGLMSAPRTADIMRLRQTMDELLKPDETFADLTNRPAFYYYLNRALPFAYSSIYAMASTEIGLGAVDSVKQMKVPVALAHDRAATTQWGGRTLRSYDLYRHFALHSTPIERDGSIFLVRPDRLTGPAPTREEQLALLDRAFSSPYLGKLPAAWGRSTGILARQLTTVATLATDRPADARNATQTAPHVFALGGQSPVLSYDISSLGLRGRDAGMLTFTLACDGPIRPEGPRMTIAWMDTEQQAPIAGTQLTFEPDNSGAVIVPIDALPRWLLSAPLKNLFIAFEPYGCRTVTLSDITFAQRSVYAKR